MVGPIREMVMGAHPTRGHAGANVASPTMMTTNDMPITLPPSRPMGVVLSRSTPTTTLEDKVHDEGISDHFGETRAQRISEFHRQDSTPVLGMWEGSYVHWNGKMGRLTGRATAFREGEEPVELSDGAEFDSQLIQT